MDKAFGGLKILRDLSFDVKRGEVVGLIGPNGAGKSTFFNVLMSLVKADDGSIRLQGEEILGLRTDEIYERKVARTFQDTKLFKQMTVLENMVSAAYFEKQVSLGRVFFGWRQLRRERRSIEERALEMLEAVGIRDKANALAANLSYGQSKLVEILKVMISDADLVLLDEPFSGLFPEMIKVIGGLVRQMVEEGRTILLVEHNMKLISEISDRVIVMDAGAKIADGPFKKVSKQPEVIEAYLGN